MSLLKVTLPSLGLLYEKNNQLYGKKETFIKRMGGKEENILTSADLLKSGRFMDELIKSCVMEEEFKNNIDNMFVGDKNALLFAIRVHGIGSDYNAIVTCKKCKNSQPHTFNLSNIKSVGICADEKIDFTKLENLFKITLDVCKKEVIFRLLSNKEHKEIESTNEKLKKITNSDIDQLVTLKLKTMIESIGNLTKKEDIGKFIDDELTRKDIIQLKKFINKITPDISMEEPFTCKKCGYEDILGLPPIDVEFFWPQ